MAIPEQYGDYLSKCVHRVEANSNEALDIWVRFCDPNDPHKYGKRHTWEDVFGWLETIGHLDDRPICVSMRVVKIDGWLVLFWEATSELVDYAMIDEWFKEHYPDLPNADAMNFHNALHHVERLEKEAIKVPG